MNQYSVVIAFWVFVGVAVVADAVGDIVKRRHSLALIKAALERGQTLDPSMVAQLMGREGGRTTPAALQTGGIVAVSSGVGGMFMSWVLAHATPPKLFYIYILGGAVVSVCVGTGLIIAARLALRREETRGSADSTT